MLKSVFFFPGVGSQYVGMSKTLYQEFPIFRETLEEAGDLLKINIADICFLKENKKELDRLENTQSILLAMSTASFRVFEQEIGMNADYCMGHSLGEYSALCSAGVFSFKEAVQLVRRRGEIVSETVSTLGGTMMWVINLDVEIVEEICTAFSQEAQETGRGVYISAYDSPRQSSISGHTKVLMKAAKKLEKAGAIVYPLKFSGPFHSPLMHEAQQQMKNLLETMAFQEPKYKIIANHNAQPYQNAGSVPENLSRQLVSPIRWRHSIQYLLQHDVRIAVEMGPKNVLKFLTKKNTDKIHTYTTDSLKDLELLGKELLVHESDYLPMMGKCLGAAVGTKNHCFENETYRERVIKPYRKIQSLYNKWKTNPQAPTKEHLKETATTLKAILNAKQVPLEEQELWFKRIFGNKVSHDFLEGTPHRDFI